MHNYQNAQFVETKMHVAWMLSLTIVCGVAGCGETPDESPTTLAETPESPESKAPPKQPPEPVIDDAEENSYPAAESTNGEFVELSFDRFQSYPPERTDSWSVADGVWRTTGKPKGYLASQVSYGDFTLKYEYRFPAASADAAADHAENTGCLVYIALEDKIWPVCLEVQGKYFETGMIKVNGRKDLTVVTEDFPGVRQEHLNSPSEWNQIEIVSEAGALTVYLNGELIGTSHPTELKNGRIGFQAENFEVEFRNVMISVP